MKQSHPFKVKPERKLPWAGVHAPDTLRDNPDHPHASFPSDHKNMFADGGLIEGGLSDSQFADGGRIPDHELTPHAQEMDLGRRLAKRSRTRSPGHAEGSDQDNLQRRLAGNAAANTLMSATMRKNRKLQE